MSYLFDKQPNAQKWTIEIVKDELDGIEKEAESGTSYFLGRALAKAGLYKQVWSYWKKTFRDNDDIIEQMLRIETLFEAKILEGALKKELSGPVAALTLKFNYNWNNKGYGAPSNPITKSYQL